MSEKKRSAPASALGARPIRKRGYYRALKRGELWAILDREMKIMWGEVAKDMFIGGPIWPYKIGGLKEFIEEEDRKKDDQR